MNSFTPRAQKVLALARKEAERLGQDNESTEHLLLGLLLVDRGIVVSVLKKLGFDVENVREQVEKIVPRRTPPSTIIGPDTYTKEGVRALRLAHEEAMSMGHSYTGTEHMLLGLLREGSGVATQIFRDRGIDLEQVRATVITELDPGASARAAEVMNPIYVRDLLEEFKRSRDELKKNFEKVADALDTLKADFAQLRADVLKGNS